MGQKKTSKRKSTARKNISPAERIERDKKKDLKKRSWTEKSIDIEELNGELTKIEDRIKEIEKKINDDTATEGEKGLLEMNYKPKAINLRKRIEKLYGK